MFRITLLLFVSGRAEELFSDSAKFERWSHFKDYGVPAVMGKDELNSAAIADGSCRLINQSQGFSFWLYPGRVKRVLTALANAPPTSSPSYFTLSAEKALRDACVAQEGDKLERPNYKLDALSASVQNWYHALVAPASDVSWKGMFDPAYQPQQVALTAGFMCIVAADLNKCVLTDVAMRSLAARTSDLRREFSSQYPWVVGSTRFSNASSMDDLARLLQPLVSGQMGGLCRCEPRELAIKPSASFCPDELHGVYADMHDGDQKEIQISGKSLTIKPSGNNQTWVIQSEIDPTSCSASVNFNVKGKPNPPPVNLQATLWYGSSSKGKKTLFGFTDPSGTLAAKSFPLNRWVEEVKAKGSDFSCPHSLQSVFVDIHDGDKKELTISGQTLIIKPSGNNQTWQVKTTIEPKSCSAIVNFDVPGKPNPPPVKLMATLMKTLSKYETNFEIEFTDPSGTISSPGMPLNHWVQLQTLSGASLII
jgi:hypothetical protein|mmetsp:Transcript_116872/g.183809  ORF Transcript_116872/g.183809 Transcript_116872/m.183809 type:complete len:479 (-) Transcript_116872:268-1704(-)